MLVFNFIRSYFEEIRVFFNVIIQIGVKCFKIKANAVFYDLLNLIKRYGFALSARPQRSAITSSHTMAFSFSPTLVRVRLKLQKFGDGGRRLISFGIRQRNFTLTASVKSQNQRFWICRRIRTHSRGFDPPSHN